MLPTRGVTLAGSSQRFIVSSGFPMRNLPSRSAISRQSMRSGRFGPGVACALLAPRLYLGDRLFDRVEHEKGRGMAGLVVPHRLEHRKIAPPSLRRRPAGL